MRTLVNKLSEVTNRIGDKRNMEEFRRHNTKGGLFRRLLRTMLLLVICSSLALTGVTFYLSASSVTKDSKDYTNRLLQQSEAYINLINDVVEQTNSSIISNRSISSKMNARFENDFEKTSNLNSLKNELVSLKGYNNKLIIERITLYTRDAVISSNNIIKSNIDNVKNPAEWMKGFLQTELTGQWKTIDEDGKRTISYLRIFKDPDNPTAKTVIRLDLSQKIFEDIVGRLKSGTEGSSYIVDETNNVIATTNSEKPSNILEQSILEKIKDMKSYVGLITLKGKKNFMVANTLEKSKWRLISVVPYSEMYETAYGIAIYTIVILVVGLMVIFLIASGISLQITTPIKELIYTTKRISEKDFSIINEKRYDILELNELSTNFTVMVNSLRNTLKETADLSNETALTAEELLSAATVINNNSEQIVKNIEEIALGSQKQAEDTTNCADISDTVNTEITSAIAVLGKVKDAKEDTVSSINKSKEDINKLRDSSHKNSEAMNRVEDTMKELESNSSKIVKILQEINSIASQTNLLSLNASIEAARAGQAGRGFAVVADEIRKLSEQSQKAANNIKGIIGEVNKSIKDTNVLVVKAQEAFIDEKHQVESSIESFITLSKSIDLVAKSIEEALVKVTVVDERKNVLTEAIESIAAVSQQNTASTEEVTSLIIDEARESKKINEIANLLTAKSRKLKEIVEEFIV